MKETLIKRFIKYVEFNTMSDESVETFPSTKGQTELALYIKKELENIGLEDICIDQNGYLYATLPSNIDKQTPTIGFISHLDTSPDMTAENVCPQIIYNYDGNDILLSSKLNIVLSPTVYSELSNYVGQDLITTDGTTLLGADDKAGIAEIVTAMEYLKNNPSIKHGTVKVAFTPDEEIGRGAHRFDVDRFACDWAYTMDGGEIGELEYENFNAASAKITINGRNVHPGYAKGKMINSIKVANEFISLIPAEEAPEHTSGYEGFYHLTDLNGTVEQSTVEYIVRDHDRGLFEERKVFLQECVEKINQKYGSQCASIVLKDQYYNMREKVEPVKHIVDIAYNAMKDCGVKPLVKPIRGGTDGSQLSYKGLPCPNIFAGGLNFHGRYEFVPIQSMVKATEVIIKIAENTAKHAF